MFRESAKQGQPQDEWENVSVRNLISQFQKWKEESNQEG